MVKEFVDEVNIPTYKWGDVGSISYNEDYQSE